MQRRSVYAIVCVLALNLSGCLLDSRGLGKGTGGAGGASGSTGGSGGAGGSTTCNDGAIQSCYSGLPATQDVGACKAGQQVCENNEWSPCLGEVVPLTDDMCDDVDADCDGDDDVAEGCAAFAITDTCHGVLLLDANDMIVMDGSSPDKATCFNGMVKAYVQPGDKVYVLEDDQEVVVTFWNIQPMFIGLNAQNMNATYSHSDMLSQYQSGGFGLSGFKQSVTPVANGIEYTLVRKVMNAKLPSFLLAL